MLKGRTWIAFVIICLLYWATWHKYHDDPKIHFKADLLLRHLLNYSLLVGVAITGWLGWKKHPDQWVCKLWVMVYAVFIICISALGVLDVTLGVGSESFRNMLTGLRIFFTSPVPYGIMIYFAKKSYRSTQANN